MLASLRKRIEREDEGFTLIELMVVVLIIAILLAIAIPTFLGARERAQDRQAQSNVRNAYSATKVFYTDEQVFTNEETVLEGIEPAINFLESGTPAAKDRQVEVLVTDNGANVSQVVCAWSRSQSGKWFGVREITTGSGAGVKYYSGSTEPACATGGTEYVADKW